MPWKVYYRMEVPCASLRDLEFPLESDGERTLELIGAWDRNRNAVNVERGRDKSFRWNWSQVEGVTSVLWMVSGTGGVGGSSLPILSRRVAVLDVEVFHAKGRFPSVTDP